MKKLIILSLIALNAMVVNAQSAYITNQLNNVYVINLASNTISTIIVGQLPYGVSVSPDGSKVYVTNGGECGGVYVINAATNTVIDTIVVGCCPQGVSVSPDGKIYVANEAETQ